MPFYRVEAWEYPTDEEGGEHKFAMAAEYADKSQAQKWAWDRLEEGFAVRFCCI